MKEWMSEEKKMYHSLFIYSFTSRQKSMVHLHNGILRSRKRERAPTLHDSMDGTGEHYAE